MDTAIHSKKNELVSHLRKREKFDERDIKTVVCPAPVRLLGEDYYETNIFACIDQNLLLTFFKNSSGTVKLYSLESPGVIKIEPGINSPTIKEPTLRQIHKTIKKLESIYEFSSGLTGTISLPYPDDPPLNRFQIGLSIFYALGNCNKFKPDIGNCCRTYIRIVLPDMGETGYCTAACFCEHGNVVSVMRENVSSSHIVHSNRSSEIYFVTALLNIENNSVSSILNSENYKKIATLVGIMTGYRNLIDISEISYDLLNKCKSKLPKDIQNAAAHYYEDLIRIREAGNLWENNKISEFGSLITASSLSKLRLNGQLKLCSIFEKISGDKGVIAIGFDIMEETLRIFIITDKKDHEVISGYLRRALQISFNSNFIVNSAPVGKRMYEL